MQKILLLTMIFLFCKLHSEIEKTEYLIEDDNKVVFSITKLMSEEAENLVDAEIQSWVNEEILPSVYLRRFVKIRDDYLALNVKVVNNSDKNIYLPSMCYLGVVREQLDEPYATIPPMQHIFTFLPFGIGMFLSYWLGRGINFFELSKCKRNILFGLSVVPIVIAGAVLTIKDFKKVNKIYKKLGKRIPFLDKRIIKICPGELYEDVMLFDVSKTDSDYLSLSPIYIKENLKKWNPSEMKTIPNDEYTYYYDEEVLDLSEIEGDIKLDGFLILKSTVKKIILSSRSTLHFNGELYSEKAFEDFSIDYVIDLNKVDTE